MNRHTTVFGSLILLSILLRFCTFFPSVINHDESTYLVLGNSILEGYHYWIDYVDTKPPGIFLLVAVFQALLGKSIFIFRLITAIWLGITAFLLYRIQLHWGHSSKAGIASGVIYLIITSLFTFYGISPNTEIFFNLFTALALLIILEQKGGWPYLIAGLALGFGFLIKYVVAFDALAFGLLITISAVKQKINFWQYFSKGALLLAGFLFPISLVYFYYDQVGYFEEAWFYGFVIPGRYPKNLTPWEYIKFVGDFLLRFLPVTIFYIYGLTAKRFDDQQRIFVAIWSLCILVAILIPGNTFGHYFIQLMLPFSLGAGWIFGIHNLERPKWLRPVLSPKVGYSILGVLLITLLYFQWSDYVRKPDYPKMAANYLNERLQDEDELYVGNAAHIIYLLTDRTPLHKHVHPSLFWTPKHYKALEIDIPVEVDLIKEVEPRFVLMRRNALDNRFGSWLQEDYNLIKSFGNNLIMIYERKSK